MCVLVCAALRIARNGFGPDACGDVVRIIKNSRGLKLLEYVDVRLLISFVY